MDAAVFTKIVSDVGIVIAILIYFVWQNSLHEKRATFREENLIKRIEDVEIYQRTKLENLATESTKVLNDVSNAITEQTHSLDDLTNQLRKRPCLLKTDSAV